MPPTMNTPESLPNLLQELESALALVQQALTQRDALQLDLHAGRVQRLMAEALSAAREPGETLSPPLRQRLALAGAQLAAQRQTLFRATTALDRAIDVLMPAEPIGLYGESGRNLRKASSGDSLTA